jgi:predicted nucleic acid-binding protein
VGLIDDLGPGPTAVDTAAFIYLIEEEPAFLPVVLPLFTEADRGKRLLVTSALTLLEVLVVPYRAGNAQLAERYELLLTRSRGLRLIDISRDLVRAAASCSASGVFTPTVARSCAAALLAGCKTFVTNDRRLPAVPGLKVLQLSAYLAK